MTQYLKYIYGLPNDRKTYYDINVDENVSIRKKDKIICIYVIYMMSIVVKIIILPEVLNQVLSCQHYPALHESFD